jgi:hypothetical protein
MNDKLGMDDKAPAAAAAKKHVSYFIPPFPFVILQFLGALVLSWQISLSINASSWASSIVTAQFLSYLLTASSC